MQITTVDIQKQNAQILVKYANGGSFTIDTKGMEISGRGVATQYSNGCYEVSEAKLNSLRKSFDVTTDF